MATVIKTWVFTADAEGLEDVGTSGIAFAWQTGDSQSGAGGCAKFTQASKSQNVTEQARRAATGETWETWGVPAGATVDSVQVTAWYERLVANLKLSSHDISARIIGSGGASVHSAGDVLAAVTLGTATDATWQAGAAGSSRAVDAGSQASTTDVRLELDYHCVTSGGGGGASVDQRFDGIELTITYTAAPVGYTLVADSGSFGLTGNAAGLTKGSVLAADGGAYALSGSAATLLAARILQAAAGSFSLTGGAAGLLKAALLVADSGSYALTGNAAVLTFSGGPISYTLTADNGSYTLSGGVAGLLKATLLVANSGSYALTGGDTSLLRATLLAAASGPYTLTGSAANLSTGKTLTAASGAYALTGVNAYIGVNKVLAAAVGGYTLTGASTNLSYSGGAAVMATHAACGMRFTCRPGRFR